MITWDDYKPKWYKFSFKVDSPEKFTELLQWMDNSLQGHKKHTVWRLTGGGIFEIRFRFQKDHDLFVLRWG